jgi:diguanylate cyclase (GGDEF)-like protein
VRKIKLWLREYIYSPETALDIKILRLLNVLGFAAILITAATRAAIGAGPAMNAVMFAMLATLAALAYVGNKYRHSHKAFKIGMIVMGNILFPITFFLLGGAAGGMPAFFVMSVFLVFFIIDDRGTLALLAGLHFAVIAACYAAGYFFRDRLPQLSPAQYAIDGVQSILTAGLMVGLSIMFQKKMYFEEHRAAVSANENLERKARSLRVINETAIRLLMSETGEPETLDRAVAAIADHAGLDRVYFWRNFDGEGGEPSYREIYRWVREGVEPRPSRDGATYRETLPNFAAGMAEKLPVIGAAGALPPEERAILSSYGVKSFLAFPIHVEGRFWGFVSYDGCRSEHVFSGDEAGVLQSGSILLAGAILRNILEKEREDALFMADIAERKAETDALTGLLNRDSFHKKVGKYLRDADAAAGIDAFMMIDVDYFKLVNDNHGHDAGDEALRQCAAALRRATRDADIVARFGGDEFVVFCKSAGGMANVESKARQICEAFREIKPAEGADGMSASVGVALSPRDGTTFGELYKKADEALYEAKALGRGDRKSVV